MSEGQDHFRNSFTEPESDFPEFEQAMLVRMKRDLLRAEDHMEPYHTRWKEQAEMYYNANKYKELRRKNLFPIPAIQELTDQFTAQIRDKLFYANRPCTVVGVEETDEADADAKQEMIDWQDFKLQVPTDVSLFIRDAAIMDVCIAKVDYARKTKDAWNTVEIDVDDEENQTEYERLVGFMPSKKELRYEKQEVDDYRGAVYTRVDPMDVYWGPDKERIDDEFPIMMKTAVTRDSFDDKPYFFNLDKLETYETGMDANSLSSKERQEMTGQKSADNYTERNLQYVEWQGRVEKLPLYLYLAQQGRLEPQEIAEIQTLQPGEKVWVVAGMVDNRCIVRMEKQAHDLNQPNYVIGCFQKQENSMIGIGPVQKAMPSQKAAEIVMGMWVENLRQSVDRKWIINPANITNVRGPINKSGMIIEVNGNVNETAKVIDQPPLSQDLYQGLAMLRQWMLDSFGLHNITIGRGDENAETLGESTMAEAYSSLRLRDYLKTFEDTFIQPFYDMRNRINMEMLDQEYVYGVIGDGVIDWRPISPQQIRANTDFVCEASTREANRAVFVNQMLQFIDLSAKIFQQTGIPVRLDKQLQEIGESGFTLKRDKMREWFPFLALEEQGQLNVDILMAQASLNQLAFMAMGGMPGMPGQGAPSGNGEGGGQQASPMSGGEAQENVNRDNQVNLRR